MKKSAIIYFMVFLFCISMTCSAQKDKMVDSSHKQRPGWIGLSSQEKFSVSATAPSLEQTQEICLNDIRQYIVTSIASSIASSEFFGQSQVSRDGISTTLREYSSTVSTRSVGMPYILGISLSNAEDIYWEKWYSRINKSHYYIYHVLYPFSSADRNRAISEFKAMDDAKNERLAVLSDSLSVYTQVSFVRQAISELEALETYFFDEARKAQAQSLRSRFRRSLDDIVIICDSTKVGEWHFHFSLNGRHVVHDEQPVTRSNHAENIRVCKKQKGYVLLYDPMAIETEENTVFFRYSIGSRGLEQRFSFPYIKKNYNINPKNFIL